MLGLGRVGLEAGGQPLPGAAADVGLLVLPVQQVVEQAVAQGALGRVHLVYA